MKTKENYNNQGVEQYNKEIVNYKEKIIVKVEKLENPATLKFILSVIESYLKSRGV